MYRKFVMFFELFLPKAIILKAFLAVDTSDSQGIDVSLTWK